MSNKTWLVNIHRLVSNGKFLLPQNNTPLLLIRLYQHQRKLGQEKDSELTKYEKDIKTLNLPENFDESQVRDQYIKLAKRYHPDSGSREADQATFQAIDIAYKNLQKKFADERHNHHKIDGEYGLYYQQKSKKLEENNEEEDAEGPDIKHTAPQHRQYLSFDGIGSGSPLHREKQYQKYRAAKAADNVVEHRIKQVTKEINAEETALSKDRKAAKKIKTGIRIERLVEDLIQESMARGDFDNLSGKGKPLKHDSSYNPYIDFTTHKLNQVLIENGFTPEWILLDKEIRQEIRHLRRQLAIERHSYSEMLTPTEECEWETFLSDLKKDCDNLNKMILKYNLVVPSLHKQIVNFQLDKEAKKAKEIFSHELKVLYKKELEHKQKIKSQRSPLHSKGESLLGMLLSSIFKS